MVARRTRAGPGRAPLPSLRLGGPGRRPQRGLVLARGPAPGALLAHRGAHRDGLIVTGSASGPSCAAAPAPASPDFSGWNWVAHSGPFSTAATNRSPPCVAQVTSGGTGPAVGAQGPVAHAVGVHEVEPLPLHPVEQRRAVGDLDGVPPHVRYDGRLQALHHPGPLVEARGVAAVLDPVREEDLHAHADAEHRTPPGQPAADDLVTPAPRGCPSTQARNAPTPGTTSPSQSMAAERSAVSVTAAPARSRARTAERVLPDP